ncbi:MAG: MATE family efflux transporter [Eubacterium sp.]|nr:MATE family efflux transporter [Eubacterium sp.]
MKNSMTEGNELKAVVLFAIPLLIGNIFQQIYSFVDAVIVGNYIGSDALAEVGASGSTVSLLILLLMGFTNGASILIAQSYGRKAGNEICRTVSGLYTIIFVFSLVLGLIGYLLSEWILNLMNTPEELLKDAATYLKIMFVGVPAVAIYNAQASIVRNMGKSIMPLVVLIISSITNVALDLVFVVNLGMGVEGVGYATLISQILSALISSVYILTDKERLMLTDLKMGIAGIEDYKSIFKMGIPTAFQSSIITIGSMCIQSLVNSFGKTTMAAYTAVNKIDTIAIQIVVSLGISVSVFAGQNIGAGKKDRIKKLVREMVLLQIIVCSLVAAIIVLNRENILRLFISQDSEEVVRIGSTYITIICVAYVSAGIMQTFLNALKGAGDILFSMRVGIIEVGIRIVVAFILSRLLSSEVGIWIATPVAWITACLCTIFRYRKGVWEKG